MEQLTAKDILGADDVCRERVDVPEWGGFLYVQEMTGTARDLYEASVIEFVNGSFKQRLDNIRAKLVAVCAVDEDGNLLFKQSQVEALGKKSGKALDRVFAVAQRVNALTDSDVEELAKN